MWKVLLTILCCLVLGLIVYFVIVSFRTSERYIGVQLDHLPQNVSTFIVDTLTPVINDLFAKSKNILIPETPYSCKGSTLSNLILHSKECPGIAYVQDSSCGIGCCAAFKAGITRLTGLHTSQVKSFKNMELSVNYATKDVYITGDLELSMTVGVYVDLAILLACTGGDVPEEYAPEPYCPWYDPSCWVEEASKLVNTAGDYFKDKLIDPAGNLMKDKVGPFFRDQVGPWITDDLANKIADEWVRDSNKISKIAQAGARGFMDVVNSVEDKVLVPAANWTTGAAKTIYNSNLAKQIERGAVSAANRAYHDALHFDDLLSDTERALRYSDNLTRSIYDKAKQGVEDGATAAYYRVGDYINHPEDIVDDLKAGFNFTKDLVVNAGTFIWNFYKFITLQGGWQGYVDHALLEDGIPIVWSGKVAIKTTKKGPNDLNLDLQNIKLFNVVPEIHLQAKQIYNAYLLLLIDFEAVLNPISKLNIFNTVKDTIQTTFIQGLLPDLDLHFLSAITSAIGTLDITQKLQSIVTGFGGVDYTFEYAIPVLDALYYANSLTVVQKAIKMGDWTIGEATGGELVFKSPDTAVCFNRVSGEVSICNETTFGALETAYMPRMFRVNSWIFYAPSNSNQLLFYFAGMPDTPPSEKTVVINKVGLSIVSETLISPFELDVYDSGLVYAQITIGTYVIAQGKDNSLVFASIWGGKQLSISSSGIVTRGLSSLFNTEPTEFADSFRWLDRQKDLDCGPYGGKALNSVQLQHLNGDGGQIYHAVTCGGIDPNSLSETSKQYRTPSTALSASDPPNDWWGNVGFLDRQNVSCPPNSVLTQYQLVGDNDPEGHFDYQCKDLVKATAKCRQETSEWASYGNGYTGLDVLKNIAVKCKPEESISQWTVQYGPNYGKYDDWFRYQYTCCRAEPKPQRPQVMCAMEDCTNPPLRSDNGEFLAVVQDDGNYVVYDAKTESAVWNSRTAGKGLKPYKLILQPDGNLALRDSTNKDIWVSNYGTVGTGPYALGLQNDGSLNVFDSTDAVTWSSAW